MRTSLISRKKGNSKYWKVEMGVVRGMQEWFNTCRSINVIHHINNMKNKNLNQYRGGI